MPPLHRWLAAPLLALGLVAAAPGGARAATKVDWARVDGPASATTGDAVARGLKAALQKAAKKASFGKLKAVTLSARVVEYVEEERGDVLRVSCTVLGRVVGGAGARSRISFGGSPAHRAELEKQVLEMVASGLVTRLAQIARTSAEKEDGASHPGPPHRAPRGARARRHPPAGLKR